MADNKYNQSLLDMGYTQEQIDSMVNAVRSGQDANAVVRGTNQPPRSGDVDLSTYDGTDGKGNVTTGPWNANLNYNQYGDDSHPNQQSQRGGLNSKYTGEGTSNTYIAYNPDLRTSDLDPNYLYGQAAKDRNRQEAGYIARRNDNIASALYNEGRVSKEDVAQFLASQNEWMNSTEADRLNTIESVWKRLGQIKPQEEEPQKEYDPSIIENALDEDTSGRLYGKVTADEGGSTTGIDTLADANSVYKAMNDGRIANVKALISMKPSTVAASMADGINPYGLQAWRDVQQYYPEFAADVQQQLKKIQGQNTVNAITSGEEEANTSTDTMKKAIENDKETMATTYSSSTSETESIREDINTAMASNQSASEASETMDRLEKDMATLKNRLKNLRTEANKIFKGDAPDYLVKAWMNNKTQEIQNQMSILEDRYNAAYQRYTTQLDQEWKDKQYDLQLKQFNLQKQQAGFNQWYQKQQLAKSNIVTDANGKTWQLKTNADGSVYFEEITQLQQYASSGMKGKGLKNNNPGNIKDTTFGNVIGTDESGFAKFATPEDGFDALVAKIQFNQTNPSSKYYGKTLREYFRIYAPSSDGNNPDAYAQSVAKQLGVSVDTPISQVDPVKLAAAIAKHDSGYDYSTYGQFREGSTGGSTWNTIDINSIKIPDDIYTIGENLDGTKITVDPNSATGKRLKDAYIQKYLQENGLVAGDGNANTSTGTITQRGDLVSDTGKDYAYNIIKADDGTPIYFRQRIYNLVPATLKNSEVELQNLYNTAKTLYKAGYTPDEASLVFYGIDPRQDTTGLLLPLIKIARASGNKLEDTFYGRLGSYLENGSDTDIKNAIMLVENSVLTDKQKEKEEYAIGVVDKIHQLEVLLSKAEADGMVGPVSSRLNELIKTWYDNPKYAYIAAQIDNIYGDIRNELLGRTITENEDNKYIGMFPEMTDQLSTIKVKLKATKKSLINEVNASRKRYDLPTLNEYSLVDYVLRSKLYTGNQSSSANV